MELLILPLGFQSGTQTHLSFCQSRERFPNSSSNFCVENKELPYPKAALFNLALGNLSTVDSVFPTLPDNTVGFVGSFPFLPLQRGMEDLESIKQGEKKPKKPELAREVSVRILYSKIISAPW